MIRHFREVVFNCYSVTGMKLQNFIHCIALTLRISKGLAKEILYEMFTASLIEVNLIELKDFGCEGCSTDITKFSKKACSPRECLVLVRIKDGAVIEAIRSELKECIASRLENFTDCFDIVIRHIKINEINAKLIVDAIMGIDYDYLIRKASETKYSYDNVKIAATETISKLLEETRKEQETIEINTILQKVNQLQTDSNEEIYRTLTWKEYAKFTALKHLGRIYYDATEKKWKIT